MAKSRKWSTEEEKQSICNDYINNVPINIIMEKNKIGSYKTIRRIIKANNLEPRKTSKELIDIICTEYTDNLLSAKELQVKYKKSKAGIKYILHSKNIDTKQKVKFNENYFENLEDKDVCYFAGLISADGWIGVHKKILKSGNEKEYPCLVVAHKLDDIELVEKFQKALNSRHKIGIYHTFDKRTEETYHRSCIQITNKKLCDDLAKIGITREKSKNLRIPTNIPKHNIRHFIRGYSDGNSCWGIEYYQEIPAIKYTACSPSYDTIVDIQNILMENCNLDHTVISFAKNCYMFSYGGNVQCQRIFEYFYGDGGISLERKRKLAFDHFQWYINKTSSFLGQ